MAASKRRCSSDESDAPAKKPKTDNMKQSARQTRQPKTCNLALQVMGALYWDLLCITQIKQIVSQRSANITITQQDITWKQSFFHEARAFVTNFVRAFLLPNHEGPDSPAYGRSLNFLNQFGWKIFAICAFSEGFRYAILNDKIIRSSDKHWDTLKQYITDNERSIEVFARSRGLHWQEILLHLTMYGMPGLPDLERALAPEVDISTEHPHHIVQTKDGGLRHPTYKGKAQKDILHRVYKSQDAKEASCLQRKEEWGSCDVCGKIFADKCNCRVHSLAGELTELVEYGDKGVGVRALANFRKRDILGEYVGQTVTEEDVKQDVTYAMDIGRRGKTGYEHLAISDAAHVGNWTRFLNHACDAPCTFQDFLAGPEATIIVRANRGVSMFEEVTVHYGDNYWKGNESRCKCGAEDCISLQ